MHKLMEYVCDELEELERKAEKGGKLSMAEIQYGDTLAHFKKNLLTADAMTGDNEYSNARGRGSNARRDSMGRYSRNMGGSYNRGGMMNNSYERGYSRADAMEDLVEQLREMEMSAPDEESKRMIQKWIKQAEMD